MMALLIAVPQVGGERLPQHSGQSGKGGTGLGADHTPEAPCRRCPKPTAKVCWSLRVQITGVGQARAGDGSNECGGLRAKARGPGAGLGRISLAWELFLLCQMKELAVSLRECLSQTAL